MKVSTFCTRSEKALQELRKRISQKNQSLIRSPVIIGIGGPGGSGKSHFASWLQQYLGESTLLTLDDFRLPRDQRPVHAPFGSHPDAVNLAALEEVLKTAREGGNIYQPEFDADTGRSRPGKTHPPASILILDGEIIAYPILQAYLDTCILVQSSLWTQFCTRLKRDRKHRKCSLFKTLRIFFQSNLIDYPRFGEGSSARAHLIFERHPRKGYFLRKNQL